MTQSICFFFAAIIIVGVLIFALVCVTSSKGKKHLDVSRYQVKYLEIENYLKKSEPSSYQLVILNADKLVGQALQELGIKGATMGERMKAASATFSDLNGFWEAHKLRNKIAHDTDASITYDQARYALVKFKKALKDLGAI